MTDPQYIACTRMYNVCESVACLWDVLMVETSRISGIALRIERHPFPADILDLWSRSDLGLTFICGRAFVLGGMHHKAVAVPLRTGENGKHSASLYSTHILVRENSPFERTEDILGAAIGWTVSHSHSGYLAVKRLLAPMAKRGVENIFNPGTGPLHTPMNCLHALKEGMVDAAPMDSFCYSLLRHNAPDKLSGTRILATTPEYPMPFLAASQDVDDTTCEALRSGLLEAGAQAAMAPVLELLCITGFAKPDFREYCILAEPEGDFV